MSFKKFPKFRLGNEVAETETILEIMRWRQDMIEKLEKRLNNLPIPKFNWECVDRQARKEILEEFLEALK